MALVLIKCQVSSYQPVRNKQPAKDKHLGLFYVNTTLKHSRFKGPGQGKTLTDPWAVLLVVKLTFCLWMPAPASFHKTLFFVVQEKSRQRGEK